MVVLGAARRPLPSLPPAIARTSPGGTKGRRSVHASPVVVMVGGWCGWSCGEAARKQSPGMMFGGSSNRVHASKCFFLLRPRKRRHANQWLSKLLVEKRGTTVPQFHFLMLLCLSYLSCLSTLSLLPPTSPPPVSPSLPFSFPPLFGLPFLLPYFVFVFSFPKSLSFRLLATANHRILSLLYFQFLN